MGLNIGIGQAKINYYPEDDYMNVSAELVEREDAPNLGKGDASGITNYRHPSYSSFFNWCKETNLIEVFYDIVEDNDGFAVGHNMKGGHPGVSPLTQEKYIKVKEALEKYKLEHPSAIMPTPENTKHLDLMDIEHKTQDGQLLDYTLGRLVWFEYWMKWVLENCKMPVISNS